MGLQIKFRPSSNVYPMPMLHSGVLLGYTMVFYWVILYSFAVVYRGRIVELALHITKFAQHFWTAFFKNLNRSFTDDGNGDEFDHIF